MTDSRGHAGFARSGQVELELDEAVGEQAGFALTMAIPPIQLRFDVSSTVVIAALSRFLREHYRQTAFAELQLGSLDGLPVLLIKDDEHPDRFFVRVTGSGMIDIEIVDPVASDLVKAAADLADEVSTE